MKGHLNYKKTKKIIFMVLSGNLGNKGFFRSNGDLFHPIALETFKIKKIYISKMLKEKFIIKLNGMFRLNMQKRTKKIKRKKFIL